MEWLRNHMELRGLTQHEVAVIAGMTDQMFTNVVKGRRSFQLDEADRIRRHFGYRLPEDMPPTIAVVGKVGAGDHIELVDGYEKGGGLYHIARPQWLPANGIAAAEITGSSAEPWALEGDIVFWRREAEGVLVEDLGRPVIAALENGRVMLKRLASGTKPGHWSLLSLNPTHPNLLDVRLLWAARALPPVPRGEVHILNVGA